MSWWKKLKAEFRRVCSEEGCEEPRHGIAWDKCEKHVYEDDKRWREKREQEKREREVSIIQEGIERAWRLENMTDRELRMELKRRAAASRPPTTKDER